MSLQGVFSTMLTAVQAQYWVENFYSELRNVDEIEQNGLDEEPPMRESVTIPEAGYKQPQLLDSVRGSLGPDEK